MKLTLNIFGAFVGLYFCLVAYLGYIDVPSSGLE